MTLKFIFTTLLLAITHPVIFAQNLVPNPSFEQTDTCLQFARLFSFEIDTSTQVFTSVLNWNVPNLSTPDYFNRCQSWYIGVPANMIGYQQPHSGNAYLGLINYDYNLHFYPNGGSHREAIQTKLYSPLEKDKLYCVSFYVSPTWHIGSPDSAQNVNYFVTDGIGLCLSKQRVQNYIPDPQFLPSTVNNAFLPCNNCIQNPSGRLLSDTAVWYKINGLYRAEGGERWLTISNFRDDAHTQRQQIYALAGNTNDGFSYVYIDDVSIELVSEPILSAHDTVICTFPLNIAARTGFNSYLWNTGATTDSLRVTQPGTYWVRVRNDCGEATDTLKVYQAATEITHRRDTTACLPTTLSASQTLNNYWNTGAQTQTIAVSQVGTYWVRSELSACQTKTDTVHLYGFAQPFFSSLRDTCLCNTQMPVHYTVPAIFTNVLWSDNSIGNAIDIYQKGQYEVVVNWQCGILRDTFIVRTEQPLEKPDLGTTQDICYQANEREVRLHSATILPNYHWSTGATTPTIYVQQAGVYSVSSQNTCGIVSDSVLLIGCPIGIYIPTAFSPNNDGVNDVFTIFANAHVRNITSMQIFDRYGELIFSQKNFYPNDLSKGWDGTFHHKPLGNDVFAYQIEVLLDNGKIELYIGDVTITY
jgi:gliding motility-associated-like protein